LIVSGVAFSFSGLGSAFIAFCTIFLALAIVLASD
jgi:hypothetical protein